MSNVSGIRTASSRCEANLDAACNLVHKHLFNDDSDDPRSAQFTISQCTDSSNPSNPAAYPQLVFTVPPEKVSTDKYRNRDEACTMTCSFTWKCCCIFHWVFELALLIFLCLFLPSVVVPKVAQSVFDAVQMTIINGTISNPTNSTITMDLALQISPIFVDATMDSVTATVLHESTELGFVELPQLVTSAGKPIVISASLILEVTDVKAFRVQWFVSFLFFEHLLL